MKQIYLLYNHWDMEDARAYTNRKLAEAALDTAAPDYRLVAVRVVDDLSGIVCLDEWDEQERGDDDGDE